jgi:hypothetical protein
VASAGGSNVSNLTVRWCGLSFLPCVIRKVIAVDCKRFKY